MSTPPLRLVPRLTTSQAVAYGVRRALQASYPPVENEAMPERLSRALEALLDTDRSSTFDRNILGTGAA